MQEAFRRFVFIGVMVLSFGLCGETLAAPAFNVYPSTSAAPGVLDGLIASVTSQWNGALVPSPWFQGTYTFIVSGPNVSYVPPPSVSSAPLINASAVDEAIAYGFGTGMDTERYATTNLLNYQRGVDISSGTCGGVKISTPTSIAQAVDYCADVYDAAISTISQRWGYIYIPVTGVQVP